LRLTPRCRSAAKAAKQSLAELASRMPWSEIEAALAPAFGHKDRKGRAVEEVDMFGPALSVAGAGASAAGRQRLPIRLMVSLLYLKHAFNKSDESVVELLRGGVFGQGDV
jgi:IS5 family transposase